MERLKPELSEAKKRALELRERLKKKRPEFRRQESWRYKRIKESWRRPRGIDSKMRLKKKGWPATVEVGYRGPKEARGLHPSGFEEVLVHNPEEVDHVDPKTQAIRIAHAVGMKKRVEIIARAEERNVYVLNPIRVEEEFEEEEGEEAAERRESEGKEEEGGEEG